MHPTLSPEEQCSKKWLRLGSASHNALRKVVLKDSLLWDMKKFSGFHHTGSLEVFYSLLLKYCPKRQHFSYVGMQARIELAILDHNYKTHNENKQQQKTVQIYCVVLCVFTEFIYFR